MNGNIGNFNRLLDKMLLHCFSDICFPGAYNFLDNKGLLSARLARDSDEIHLGPKGISQFVRCMKLWIFEREASEKRVSRNSRQAVSHVGGST